MQTQAAASSPTGAISSEGFARRYEALIRLAELIRSHPEEKDLFQTCASELHQVISFDGISQFDPGANRVQWHFLEPYNKAFESVEVTSIPKEETAAWWVYQNQQPFVVQSVDREPRFPQVLEVLRKLGLRSLCILPLSTAHRQLGSLGFASHLDNAYSPEDQRFLALVANQIALAMDDARAQQRLKLLLDLTNRIVTKLELPDLLQEISASIRQVMQCDVVGVALPDLERGELRRCAMDFPGHQEIIEPEHISESIKRVFQSGKSIHYTREEIAADPIVATRGHHSLSGLPLLIRGRVLGVLGVASSRENAFTEDDLTFLGQVASQIALAVENAFTYEHISQLKDRLAQENVYLESEIRSELHFEDIVGNSEPLRRVLKEIETVAPADSTVLIYGETGTGKELIARALHNLSSRRSNAFVKLNCAAIPTGLLESELLATRKVRSPAR